MALVLIAINSHLFRIIFARARTREGDARFSSVRERNKTAICKKEGAKDEIVERRRAGSCWKGLTRRCIRDAWRSRGEEAFSTETLSCKQRPPPRHCLPDTNFIINTPRAARRSRAPEHRHRQTPARTLQRRQRLPLYTAFRWTSSGHPDPPARARFTHTCVSIRPPHVQNGLLVSEHI